MHLFVHCLGLKVREINNLFSCSNFVTLLTIALPGSSVYGILQQESLQEWAGYFLPQGFSNPGIKPASRMSPTGVLTTQVTPGAKT